MKRRVLFIAAIVLAVVLTLLLAFCPKPSPPKPVPAAQRDPAGEIHHDGR